MLFRSLDTKPQPYGFTFSMKDPTDATVELAFHAGGQMVQGPGPAEICIDDVVLSDPAFVPPPPPAPVVIPDVRVNQQGYLPKAVKVAAWVTDVGEAKGSGRGQRQDHSLWRGCRLG